MAGRVCGLWRPEAEGKRYSQALMSAAFSFQAPQDHSHGLGVPDAVTSR